MTQSICDSIGLAVTEQMGIRTRFIAERRRRVVERCFPDL